MKRLYFIFAIILCFIFTSLAQNNVGISDDNSNPKASAMLDVYSASKGLLIPRIALTATATAAPVTAPEASLLIYNTASAGDVTPGYYYWNGSTKWVRLITSADPTKNFNMVTKTVNATLLKTENVVLAIGDITLTLPTVTSADDGLEITVKNMGAVIDQTNIIPEAGKRIDANTSAKLLRWRSLTFIASGSNWIVKEKVAPTDNSLTVSESGSFTTIAEVVEFLKAHSSVHMTGPTNVLLGGGIYTIAATQTINLPYPVTFQGSSYGETTINATSGISGSPLFICQTECYFKMLTFNAISNVSGNDALHFTGSGKYHEVKECKFIGFNKGAISKNNNNLWFLDNDFNNCTGAGIEIAAGIASGGSLKISESDFTQCANGISLLSGLGEAISILNCTFYNTTSGTDVGILYTPVTFSPFSTMFITNNAWNNQGTFMSGFNFTLANGRDANAFITNNSGMENENPHCKISVLNSGDTTKISIANNYKKAHFSITTSYTSKFTIVNNRITYQPIHKNDVHMYISGNISVKNAGKTINFGICKNGINTIRYGESTIYAKDAGQPYQFTTVVYLSDVGINDYFEFFVTSSSNGDILTVQDLNWLVTTN